MNFMNFSEPVVAQGCDCTRDRLWVRSPSEELKKKFHFFAPVWGQSAAFSSATQHAMPPEFGRKWRAKHSSGFLCLLC